MLAPHMKKWIVILIILPVIGSAAWFFWPNIQLLTTDYPITKRELFKKLSMSDPVYKGGFGSLSTGCDSYSLGFKRILTINTKTRTDENGDVYFDVVHAKIRIEK
jgi:hypothetical protein